MDVIGLGNVVTDLVAAMDEIPAHNSRANITGYKFQGGGMVSTALVALARLGAHVGQMGVIGDDVMGQMAKTELEGYGVDTSRIITQPGGASIFSLVLSYIKDKSRNILNYPGTVRLAFEEMDRDYLASARAVHLAINKPYAKQAAAFCKGRGMVVSLDADIFFEEDLPMLKDVDIFIAAEECYRRLYPAGDWHEHFGDLHARGPGAVVVSFGAQGCKGYDGTGFYEVEAYPVEVVDTTGAGDVFHGAYLYGWLQGWPMEECLRFSSVVASLNCTAVGGRAGIPSLEEAQKALREWA